MNTTTATPIAIPTTNTPTGFSFTTMFFGPLPVLFRGNWQLALGLLGIFIFSLIPIIGWLMFPLFFIAPAVVNRLHADGTFNPFPMQQTEVKNACVYFGIWLAFMGALVALVGVAALAGMAV